MIASTVMTCGCLMTKDLLSDTVLAVHVCNAHANDTVVKFLLDALYGKLIKSNAVKKLMEQNNVQC